MKRLKILGLTIEASLVLVDEDTLEVEPVGAAPLTITGAQLDGLPGMLRSEIAQQEAHLNE